MASGVATCLHKKINGSPYSMSERFIYGAVFVAVLFLGWKVWSDLATELMLERVKSVRLFRRVVKSKARDILRNLSCRDKAYLGKKVAKLNTLICLFGDSIMETPEYREFLEAISGEEWWEKFEDTSKPQERNYRELDEVVTSVGGILPPRKTPSGRFSHILIALLMRIVFIEKLVKSE